MIIQKISEKKYEIQCDECGNTFEKYITQTSLEYQFCSRKCTSLAKQEGHCLFDKACRTNLAKYGVTNVFASEEIKKKIKATSLEKYGVDNPNKCAEVREKIKATSLEKYGVDNPSKSDAVKQKALQTNLERYGAKASTCLEETKEKVRKTNIERYGVPYQMQREDIRSSFDFASVYLKSNETKRLRGRNGKSVSLVEIDLVKELQEIFGIENVDVQLPVNKRWVLDAYVKTHDVYVQLDGVYWHGLNRPVEKILKFESSKDVSIYRKLLSDHEQNSWFVENGKRLVRITDTDFRKWQKKNKQFLQEKIRQMILQGSSSET